MPEPTFDVAAAHRWFAIDCNNAAWDLIEQADRTASDTDRMLHLAHASCWHWQQIGQPIHQLRGLTLLATAYVAARLPAGAVRFAERGLDLSQEVSDATPFDRACAHGAVAAAYQLAGQNANAKREYDAAYSLAAKFDDADDRAVFERLYPRP
ncbi:MAG TPA: hypothetical protein VM165_11015 [Planctomycetaceae bacterium]|nr:hypothetical protein [Planctomycetaceae bacterium]